MKSSVINKWTDERQSGIHLLIYMYLPAFPELNRCEILTKIFEYAYMNPNVAQSSGVKC